MRVSLTQPEDDTFESVKFQSNGLVGVLHAIANYITVTVERWLRQLPDSSLWTTGSKTKI